MENGYAICMNEWSLDKTIKNELGLLLIISSLCAEKGYCYASNSYLAKLFNITEQSVSNKIKKLEGIGYLIVDYKYRGTEIINREIRIKNIYTDHIKKIIPTIEKNVKDNNISINNNNLNEFKLYNNFEKNVECEEITKNNKKCVRRSSFNINGKNYCNQHARNLIPIIFGNETQKITYYYENEELNDLFNEFLNMRKKLKAINSERAINMLIKKLEKYDDATKYKMIEQSILNSWKDIYPLKEKKKSGMDKFNEVLERFERGEQ